MVASSANRNVPPNMVSILKFFSLSFLVTPMDFIQAVPNTLGWYQIKPIRSEEAAARPMANQFIRFVLFDEKKLFSGVKI